MSIHVCDHCGKPIPDDAAVCPHCGAEQQEDIRLNKIPETIGELRAFCDARYMPLERMRFFIGEDCRGARAFGIYKDEDGSCVVYKNKSDGSRAIRYKGPDEKHAVRELYEKLKSETELRRGISQSRPSGSHASSRKRAKSAYAPPTAGERVRETLSFLWKPAAILFAAVLALVLITRWAWKQPDRGYYRYQDSTYYYQNLDWYRYNTALGNWEEADDVPESLKENYGDFFQSAEYDTGCGVEAFSYGSVYGDNFTSYSESVDYDYGSGSDYDSSSYDDYDWDDYDYSSWDSDDTDWDSDW